MLMVLLNLRVSVGCMLFLCVWIDHLAATHGCIRLIPAPSRWRTHRISSRCICPSTFSFLRPVGLPMYHPPLYQEVPRVVVRDFWER